MANLSFAALTPPEIPLTDNGKMKTKKKILGRRKIRPYRKWKTFLWKNLVFPKEVGVIYSRSRQSKIGTNRSFMGKFFPKKDPFQNSEITFPLACKSPTEKVLIDFTCFSWEVAFTRGLQPSIWGLRAQALLAWSHGCAFPAASASKKQKWQTWSGQWSHQMWILPVEKLNHLNKT